MFNNLILFIIKMMKFNLDKLNFKLQPPSTYRCKTTPDIQQLQDTETSHHFQESHTPNPFRHSYHLWKDIHEPSESKNFFKHDNNLQLRTISRDIEEKEIILQNFDSFQDGNFIVQQKNHKQLRETSKIDFKLDRTFTRFEESQRKENSFIRIQSSELSLIQDDFNADLGYSSLFDKGKEVKQKKQSSQKDIFFLTAQQQSQSSIKQFYFNLNTSNEDLRSFTKIKTEEPQKNQVKKIIYAFIDELQTINENDINPQFVGELKNFLDIKSKEKNLSRSPKPRFKEKFPLTERKNISGKQNKSNKSKKAKWI